MIRLPDLAITRDEFQEVKVYQEVKTWLEHQDAERSDSIHASDLPDPRLAYWKRKAPKEITERQVWFYSIGKVLHNLVLILEGEQTDTGTHTELDILFSPDRIQNGEPVELKTHRGFREPTITQLQAEFSHYFEQLLTYCILKNSLVGHLWVLFINLKDRTGRTFPEIRCYTVTITEEQFYSIEASVLEPRDQLRLALDKEDHTSLPLCRSWLCGDNCAWYNVCKPGGRWPQKDRRSWTA